MVNYNIVVGRTGASKSLLCLLIDSLVDENLWSHLCAIKYSRQDIRHYQMGYGFMSHLCINSYSGQSKLWLVTHYLSEGKRTIFQATDKKKKCTMLQDQTGRGGGMKFR